MIRKYTQEEFSQFKADENGFIQCPTGDYTEIEDFPAKCSFGEGCSFGKGCSFGDGCSFGKVCSFGNGCSFGDGCSFGEGCSFGKVCSFGDGCKFGERCSFGEWCGFGEGCSFGERCNFGEGCGHEGLHNSKYFACDRIGSKQEKIYFFKSDEGYFVRASRFFGTMDEFVDRVKTVHEGTKFERGYLMAAELAKVVLDEQ